MTPKRVYHAFPQACQASKTCIEPTPTTNAWRMQHVLDCNHEGISENIGPNASVACEGVRTHVDTEDVMDTALFRRYIQGYASPADREGLTACINNE